VAALAVVASHLLQSLTWRMPGWEAAAGGASGPIHALTGTAGAWGVGLFLVVSGTCIHLPVARRLRSDPGAALGVGAFLSQRLLRVYPPFLAALALGVAVAAALPAPLRGSTLLGLPGAREIASHLLLVHTFVPGHHEAANGALWTVALEVHLYLLYPLLLALRRRAGVGWTCALLLGLAVLSRAAAWALLPPGWRTLVDDTFLRRAWEFGLGMWVAERLAADPRPRASARAAWGGLCLLSVAGGLALAFAPGGLRLRALLWPPLLAAAVEAAARWRPGASWPERAGRWLGERAYSLYLVHPVGLALGAWAAAGSAWGRGAAGPAMLGFTALAFLGFHRLVERPVEGWRRKRRSAQGARVQPSV
jgi:peptidoglycan/LPS O-acetylase OafA/YrhL